MILWSLTGRCEAKVTHPDARIKAASLPYMGLGYLHAHTQFTIFAECTTIYKRWLSNNYLSILAIFDARQNTAQQGLNIHIRIACEFLCYICEKHNRRNR